METKPTSLSICKDVEENSTEVEDVTEEEIESNFTSYRPYIESCIKLLDLIVFFNMFTPAQVKMFYKLSKSDPAKALRRAFDAIVEINNVRDKFHILVHALEEAEYPKIVNLLRGLLIRVHGEHRQKLKTYAKDIYQRLSVCDILPYLLTKRVVNHHDIEEIKSVEKNESRGSAVMQLLSILPNRSTNWYEHFLWALVESKQKALAMIIDKEFTEKLEEAAMLGIAPPIAKSSLQVSVKGLRKRLARSQSISGLESMGQELIKSLEHAESMSSISKHDQAGVSDKHLRRISGDELHYYSKKENDAEIKIEVVDVDEVSKEEVTGNSHVECGPCKRRNHGEVKAKQFCIECNENLCSSCKDFHDILKPTQGHKVVPNNEEQNQATVFDPQLHNNTFYCDCHKNHLVEIYCQNHSLVVCLECRSTHHENCDTFVMKEQSDNILKQLETAVVQRAEELNDMLAKLEMDRKRDLSKLYRSKEICSKHILGFVDELQKYLDELKQKAFEELNKQEEIQQLRITDCISSCQNAKQRVNYEMEFLQNNWQTQEKDSLSALHLSTLKFLRTTKITIDMMQNEVYFYPITFEQNSALDMVKTAVRQLGVLKSVAVSQCLEQEGSFASVNQEEYSLISDSNSNKPVQSNVNPDDSLNTEASFLKPYYQFIKNSGDSIGWEIV